MVVFVELVLKQEQEEYQREGIEWEVIEYFNNEVICQLVERPHVGLFAILDEACLNVGQVNDTVSAMTTSQTNNIIQHF
jgi:myosin-1